MKNETKLFGQLEPKFKNRFIVNFDKFPISSWLCKSVICPRLIVDVIKETKGDEDVYTAGTKKWDNIQIELLDPIGPSTTSLIYEHAFNKNEEEMISVELLDPVGMVIEAWEIKGKLVKVDFGKLDVTDEDPVIITLDFEVITANLLQ